MQIYKNINNTSNIISYKIGNDFIKIKFKNSPCYIYTYSSAGKNHIEIMKTLANQGFGLNSYIQSHVKKLYSHIE